MSLKERFDQTAAYVKTANFSKPVPDDRKLLVYKFFKQATVGDVQGGQPYAIQFEARAKWDAWNTVKGMSKDAAMEAYIAEVEKQKKEFA